MRVILLVDQLLAARSLGLDCGPMSGFKPYGVNNEFFKDTSWRANFICNIGHGTTENLFPRLPRLAFGEACQVSKCAPIMTT